jgi:hypothetical protein
MKCQSALAQGKSPRVGTFASRVILFATMTGTELPIPSLEEIR